MAKKINRQILSKAYGSEPEYGGEEDTIIEGINWYVTTADKRNYKKWTLEWVKDDRSPWDKQDYDYVRRNPNKNFRRIGHYCRMLSRGYPAVEQLTKYVDEDINMMIGVGKRRKELTTEKALPSPHERMMTQVHELACDINQIIDDVNDSLRNGGDFHKNVNIFKWLKERSVGHRQAKLLGEEFVSHVQELTTLLTGKDKDLKEGFSYFTKPQQKKYHDIVKSIVDDCNRYSEENKPIIVRKKRKRDPSKVTARVKYQETNSEYGLRSEAPQDLIDSKKVVVFNTKYRVLSVYYAKDGDVLTVKGTSILNYDTEKSESRTIKKPKTLIKTIKSEMALKKVWDSQTSITKKPNGRLNEFTVIVKVFK